MIVDTRITFRADILPARARKPKKGLASAMRSFEIAEIADAPIALDDGDINLRLHDGALWKPVSARSEAIYDLERIVRELLSNTNLNCIGSPFDKIKRAMAEPADRVVRSVEENVASLVQRYLDENVVSITGVMHQRALSPLLMESDLIDAFGPDAKGMLDGRICAPAWNPVDDGAAALSDRLKLIEAVDDDKAKAVMRNLRIRTNGELPASVSSRAASGVTIADSIMTYIDRVAEIRRRSNLVPNSTGENAVLRTAILAPYLWKRASEAGLSVEEALASVENALVPSPVRDAGQPDTFAPGPVGARSAMIRMQYASIGGEPITRVSSWGSLSPPKVIGIAVKVAEGPSTILQGLPADIRHHPDFGFLTGPRRVGDAPVRPIDLAEVNGIDDVCALATAVSIRDQTYGMFDKHDVMASFRRGFGNRPMESALQLIPTLEEFALHRLVVHDGKLMARCPEPTISIAPTRSYCRVGLSTSWTALNSPGINPPYLYRLDQIEKAMETVGRFRGRKDDDELPTEDWRLPEDLREHLSFDDDLWNIRAAAMNICATMDGRISLLPDVVGDAFLRLDRTGYMWAIDAMSVEGKEATASFIEDVKILSETLKDPLFEDIGTDIDLSIMRECLQRRADAAETLEPTEDEPFEVFAM